LNFDISENAIVEKLILKYESQNKRAGFLNEKSVKKYLINIKGTVSPVYKYLNVIVIQKPLV
jgi:hypothetical protein